jgi:hypothetical protein
MLALRYLHRAAAPFSGVWLNACDGYALQFLDERRTERKRAVWFQERLDYFNRQVELSEAVLDLKLGDALLLSIQ